MKRRPPRQHTKARKLRRNPTEAEKMLWRILRQAFPEAHFRQQVPIRQYFADFASHRVKLVIEADGGQHTAETDAARTAVIEADGYCLLRFWNHDILGNPEGVAQTVAAYLRNANPPTR